MLYAEDADAPLPTQEEVLICTPHTTAEEVKFDVQYYPLVIFRSCRLHYSGEEHLVIQDSKEFSALYMLKSYPILPVKRP